MSYKIVDTFRSKVIGTYKTKEELEWAYNKLCPENNRYEIVAPKPKKKSNVKKEGD